MAEQRMDIEEGQGTRVRYAHPKSGHDHDIENARKHLVLGKIYMVARTEVHEWSTDVWL